MTPSLRHWRGPLALVALSLVPAIAGAVRLAGLATGAAGDARDARFFGSPFPIVLHVVAATGYAVLGAFQLSAGFRRRWPAWHRRAGRVLAALGLVAALSGIWMAVRYAIPAPLQGPLLLAVRVGVGAAMVASIAIGVVAIVHRDVPRHEAWMIRAYALGQGAGTQVLVLGPAALLSGDVLGPARDLLMTLAWGINLAVAEHVIRRASRARGAAARAATAAPQPG